MAEIARDEGFRVHDGKTRVRTAAQRQVVTGLVVNSEAGPQVARRRVRPAAGRPPRRRPLGAGGRQPRGPRRLPGPRAGPHLVGGGHQPGPGRQAPRGLRRRRLVGPGRSRVVVPGPGAATVAGRDDGSPAPGVRREGTRLHAPRRGRGAVPGGGDHGGGRAVPRGGQLLRQVGDLPGGRRPALGRVLFSVDHHRGSEENQAGWEHPRARPRRPRRRPDGHAADLPAHGVRRRAGARRRGGRGRLARRGGLLGCPRWRCCSSTAATASSRPASTTRAGRRTSPPAAAW